MFNVSNNLRKKEMEICNSGILLYRFGFILDLRIKREMRLLLNVKGEREYEEVGKKVKRIINYYLLFSFYDVFVLSCII